MHILHLCSILFSYLFYPKYAFPINIKYFYILKRVDKHLSILIFMIRCTKYVPLSLKHTFSHLKKGGVLWTACVKIVHEL